MIGAVQQPALERIGAYQPICFTVVRNRPVRSRMQGGVETGGEIPPVTRLALFVNTYLYQGEL